MYFEPYKGLFIITTMKEKINKLEEMIKLQAPDTMEYLQSIMNEVQTEEEKKQLEAYANTLLISANQTLEKIENMI